MTDEQYVELMKKLNPQVIVSPALIEKFRLEYPPKSAKLLQLQMMIAIAPIVKAIKGK